MKVYLIEAVDPEERKLRQKKLLDASRRAEKGSQVAMDVGNRAAGERLAMKSMRARHIATRNKTGMAMHRATKQALVKAVPKVDPETRAIRRYKIMQHANHLRSAASIARKAGDTMSSLKLGARARKASGIAKAYGGDSKAKNIWQNVHRDTARKYAKPSAAKVAPLEPKLKKNSPVSREGRKARFQKLLAKADVHIKGREAWMNHGEPTGHVQKRGPDKGEPMTAFDHGIEAKRAHMIVAKFLKAKHQRGTEHKAIRYLRKGMDTTGRFKNWTKLRNPLQKHGIMTDPKG